MSAELIGIIAATIALGSVLLTLARGFRQDLRAETGVLRKEISVLRGEMKAGHDSVRGEVKAGHDSLRGDMQTGFKELNTRVGTVEQQLAKVEGIIEGLFWSARNEPPDRPREGVA